MQIFNDIRFRKSIEENLNKIPEKSKADFSKIKKLFPLNQIYILGGFVRDSILQVLYNYRFPLNDLDILIDDKTFGYKIKNFPRESLSRFGGLKFKYGNFSIDVFGMENIFFLKDNPKLEKNLENVLKGCDISTSALAYNLEKERFYGCNASKDIFNREVNLTNHNYLEIGPSISRLILHADKMNFKIGEKGGNYIKKNYSEKIDKEILDYLKYKKVEHLFPLIKDKIVSIMK